MVVADTVVVDITAVADIMVAGGMVVAIVVATRWRRLGLGPPLGWLLLWTPATAAGWVRVRVLRGGYWVVRRVWRCW